MSSLSGSSGAALQHVGLEHVSFLMLADDDGSDFAAKKLPSFRSSSGGGSNRAISLKQLAGVFCAASELRPYQLTNDGTGAFPDNP